MMTKLDLAFDEFRAAREGIDAAQQACAAREADAKDLLRQVEEAQAGLARQLAALDAALVDARQALVRQQERLKAAAAAVQPLMWSEVAGRCGKATREPEAEPKPVEEEAVS